MNTDLPLSGGSQPPPEPRTAGASDPAQPGPAQPVPGSSSAAGSDRPDSSSSAPAGSSPTPPPPPSAPGDPAGAGPSGGGASGGGASGGGAGHGGWSGHGGSWSGHGGSGSGAGSGGGHGTDEFFDRIRSGGVTRPEEGRWISGVAAGVSRRWDIDPVLVRGIFIALAVFGGIGVIFYGLAWLLLPQDDGRIHLQQAIRGDFTAGFVGALLLTVVGVTGGGGNGPWDDGFWFGWFFPGGLFLSAAIIFGIWWLARRNTENGDLPRGTASYGSPVTAPSYSSTTKTDWATVGQQAGERAAEASRQAGERAAEATRRATERGWARTDELTRASKSRRARSAPSKVIVRLSLGIALLIAAAIVLIGNANDWSEPVGLIAAASALAVIATGVILSGLSGRRSAGLAGIGLLLTVGVLIGAGAENAGVRTDQHVTLIGETNWEPDTRAEAENQFNLGLGEGTLWLTDPAILAGTSTTDPLRVRVRLGVGHLTVVLPESVSGQVDLVVRGGEVNYPDGTSDRFESRNGDFNSERRQVHTGTSGEPRIIVDVQQGVGQLDIETSSGLPSTVTTPSAGPSGTPEPSVSVTPTPTPTKN